MSQLTWEDSYSLIETSKKIIRRHSIEERLLSVYNRLMRIEAPIQIREIINTQAQTTYVNSFTDYFFLARRQAELYKKAEQESYASGKTGPWDIRMSPLSSYSQTFAELLSETVPNTNRDTLLHKWLTNRKKKQTQVCMMDFMGPGGFTNEAEPGRALDAELGVTLVDFMAKKNPKHSIAYGDVLQGKTWKQIGEFLMKNNTPGFDLIVWRAKAGLESIFPQAQSENLESDKETMAFLLVRKLILNLHPEGGMLLIDPSIPDQRPLATVTPLVCAEYKDVRYEINEIKKTIKVTRGCV